MLLHQGSLSSFHHCSLVVLQKPFFNVFRRKDNSITEIWVTKNTIDMRYSIRDPHLHSVTAVWVTKNIIDMCHSIRDPHFHSITAVWVTKNTIDMCYSIRDPHLHSIIAVWWYCRIHSSMSSGAALPKAPLSCAMLCSPACTG